MAELTYQRALQKREDLRRQLAEIEEFIRIWNRHFGTDGEHKGGTGPQPETTSEPQAADSGRPGRSPTRERAARTARKVILEKGSPMTRGELVAAFHAEGAPVAGTDPSRNMGTIMWRLRDRFINLEGHGYWPKDVALPEYDYVPKLPDV